MSGLTIEHARRKLELGIERKTAVMAAQEARIKLAERNATDARGKLDEAYRQRRRLGERLNGLGLAEKVAEELP